MYIVTWSYLPVNLDPNTGQPEKNESFERFLTEQDVRKTISELQQNPDVLNIEVFRASRFRM